MKLFFSVAIHRLKSRLAASASALTRRPSESMTFSPSSAHWSTIWTDVEQAPFSLWKSHELLAFDKFHLQLLATALGGAERLTRAKIVVPLAGDCLFVKTAVETAQCDVAAIEFVPRACDLLCARFEGTVEFWRSKRADDMLLIQGKAPNGADVRIFNGDIMFPLPELVGWADVVYDKDAFGALLPEQRAAYVALIKTYLKAGGTYLLAGAFRHANQSAGPPFHVDRALVESMFCADASLEIVGEPVTNMYSKRTEETNRNDITFVLKKKAA